MILDVKCVFFIDKDGIIFYNILDVFYVIFIFYYFSFFNNFVREFCLDLYFLKEV